MKQTRRALLRTVPLAATAGLAGCSAFSGDDTDSSTATPDESPTSVATGQDDSLPPARRWLVPPSALGRDHYPFVSLRPAEMLGFADALPTGQVRNLRADIGLAGFDTVGSLDGIYRLGGATVYDGPFDRDALVAALTGAGFSEAGSVGGFTRYSADDLRAVAVGDDAAVVADLRGRTTDVTARSVTTAAVEAATGAGDRYQDVNEDCAALFDALGAGHVFTGETGSTVLDAGAAVAQGGRWQLGADTTTVETAFVFRSAEATEPDLVESWATKAGPFGGVSPTVSTGGRVVVAAADVPTGAIDGFDLSAGSDTPQAAFGFEYDGTAGTLRVTHQGGDAIPAESLELRGEGVTERPGVDQTTTGQWQGEASGEGNTVVPGDSVLVGVTPSYQVLVLYTPDSGRGVTLGQDSGPEA